MKKKLLIKKSFYKLLILLLFTICILETRIDISAKQKDVTNSVANKKDIEELVQIFNTPCGYTLNELMKKGRTKNFDFSKTSDRRKILNLCYEEIYDKTISKYTLSMRMFDKNTTGVHLLVGEWGSSGPQINIKNIYKISSNNLKVVASVNWYNSVNDSSKKIGAVRIYLKKNENTYYGYIVESMKLEKTANT